jgi:hypothetical protein
MSIKSCLELVILGEALSCENVRENYHPYLKFIEEVTEQLLLTYLVLVLLSEVVSCENVRIIILS